MRAQWLGQAGFLIEKPDSSGHILIDPYLSESLAAKYRGKMFRHLRLRPAPVAVSELPALTAVLSTHAHTDHMDPWTLQALFAYQPELPFVHPRAVANEATIRSGNHPHTAPMTAGETITIGDLTVTAVASAHEERVCDADGNDRFLGYVMDFGDRRIYHSGDCTPWDGLAEVLAGLNIDIALLPVNGRDAERLSNGVPGNFSFTETVDLCAEVGIGILVPHHWGMFEFNTVAPESFDLAYAANRDIHIRVPKHGRWVDLGPRRS